MTRKISLSVIICWLMGLLFSFFAVCPVSAAEIQTGDMGDGFTWTYWSNTKTLVISGEGVMPDIDIDLYYTEYEPERIYWDPETEIDSLEIRDSITDISALGELFYGLTVKRVFLGTDMASEEGLTGFVTEQYYVDDDNAYFSVYDGLLYNKDGTKLIACPNNKSDIDFNENLIEIGDGAFKRYVMSDTIIDRDNNDSTPREVNGFIIPWGVEKLGHYIFEGYTTSSGNGGYVVLPDTITSIDHSLWSESSRPILIFSKNIPIRDALHQEMIWIDPLHEWGYSEYDSVAEYYPDAVQTGLVYENGKAYIYDGNGNMLRSGWYQAGGDWYYLNDYGAGVVNCWRMKDGEYVYLGSDGKMAVNQWIQDYGDWYYVQADGTRYESTWARIGGNWYWFGGSGKMMSDGWLKLADGYWYYFNPSGAMATGWKYVGGKWYYLTGSGAMAANRWVQSGGLWYYVGSSGAMLTNTTTPDGHWVNGSGVRVP